MTAGGDTVPRRPRRDAERNRAALLQAAAEVFAEHGAGAGVDLVARRAGLGTATLYRHFPTKVQLIDEVMARRSAAMVERIRSAADTDDPVEAFRGTLHALSEAQAEDRLFRDLLRRREPDLMSSDSLHEVHEILRCAVVEAQAAGVLRHDVTIFDVFLALIAIDAIAGSAARDFPDALRRFVIVVSDGLCHAGTPLTGEPLDTAGLEAVMRTT